MTPTTLPINRGILQWARKEANLSPRLAAEKAGIKDLKQKGNLGAMSSALRLERWEQGPDTPTFAQLEKLAKAYRRPVLTFFLSEPPRREREVTDFRVMGNRTAEIMLHQSEFSALVRQTQATQKSVREILLESGKEPLRYVGSVSLSNTDRDTATAIRAALGMEGSDQTNRSHTRDLFASIREKAEDAGIYVLVQGNLGSAHTNMGPEVFRGFTLSDSIAPFVVINPNDTKTANLFTLVHELCHVGLGHAAVSNWTSLDVDQQTPDSAEELFCDSVAAEFLVPRQQLLRGWDVLTIAYDTETTITRMAHDFAVSPLVIARRLLTFRLISSRDYWTWYNDYQLQWTQLQRERKSATKKGPGYATRTKAKLGKALIATVIEASRQGTISDLEASHILNVKLDNFSKIV